MESLTGPYDSFGNGSAMGVSHVAWVSEEIAAWVAERLDQALNRIVGDFYVYTGAKPLPDPDIVELITLPFICDGEGRLADHAGRRGPYTRMYDRASSCRANHFRRVFVDRIAMFHT